MEMTYIFMSLKVICEGAKRPRGARVWEGVSSLPGQIIFLPLEPEETVSEMSDAYLGAKITRI